MLVAKNTYGVTTITNSQYASPQQIGELGGSCINRKKYDRVKQPETEPELSIKKLKKTKKKEIKLRKMSKRTKSKIRSKLIAFSQVHEKLTFLTLTFLNEVEDQKAVKVLKSFLDNATKRFDDFQYVWVAEKQTKNAAFKDNIHFHLVTNQYWKLDKWWNYWLDVQKKHKIVPREESFKPTSAFNVRLIKSDNVKGIGTYLTKYVTKNTSEFRCQVWNCSKKISRLYTCFYSGVQIMDKFERLQHLGLLDGEIKTYHQDYCNVNIIPLNKLVMRFYDPIATRNKERWTDLDEKEVKNV
jgi:hypothetical protein